MNTEYYRILLRTVEIGNITKAADLLGYTQSGISRIIGKVEEELGTSLVHRNRTGITLRSEAEPLLHIITQIIQLENQLCQASESIRKNGGGCIRIATFRTAAVEIVASATIASYIGAGGLGVIIFSGLNLLRYDLLIIGGGAVAILSLATGFVLDQLLKYMTRYRRA